ncbi:uncharacterized protein LOC133795632 [Humulus lupulus]|uniref:uncharacterized protein LOC133795632 n=1 Tax=Humulus lupulus TaxID=3486 RepID=UPI002B407481|nr:uncharacterized protein LOC133795632 [Humulus lupulus]
MATENEGLTSDASSHPSTLSNLNMSNGSSSHGTKAVSLVSSHKFYGHNYLQWSQLVMMYIGGKGKEKYLIGEIDTPKTNDPKYKTWKADNHMIKSWLISSMNNDIGDNFLLYTTARELWDAVKNSYSSQLDLFESYSWKCVEDTALYRSIVGKRRTFKFLHGLNKDLDAVRSRIMSSKPLPQVKEAFSEVRHEESRKKVMMGSSSLQSTQNSSTRGQFQGANQDNRQQKGRPWCDHCRRPGHFRETCWKIHGKPANWKPKSWKDKESHGNVAAT